jgi:hypothetical protein
LFKVGFPFELKDKSLALCFKFYELILCSLSAFLDIAFLLLLTPTFSEILDISSSSDIWLRGFFCLFVFDFDLFFY